MKKSGSLKDTDRVTSADADTRKSAEKWDVTLKEATRATRELLAINKREQVLAANKPLRVTAPDAPPIVLQDDQRPQFDPTREFATSLSPDPRRATSGDTGRPKINGYVQDGHIFDAQQEYVHTLPGTHPPGNTIAPSPMPTPITTKERPPERSFRMTLLGPNPRKAGRPSKWTPETEQELFDEYRAAKKQQPHVGDDRLIARILRKLYLERTQTTIRRAEHVIFKLDAIARDAVATKAKHAGKSKIAARLTESRSKRRSSKIQREQAKVRDLAVTGTSKNAIAKKVGQSRRTVSRRLKAK